MTKSNQIKLISSSMVNLLILFCVENNLNVDSNLSEYETDELVPFWKWMELLDQINDEYFSPVIGLEISNYMVPKHLGLLGYIFLSSESIVDVLNSFIKYQRLIFDVKEVEVSYIEKEILITFHDSIYFSNKTFFDDLFLGVFFNMIVQLVAPNTIRMNRIEFTDRNVKFLNIYEDFFGCDVSFKSNSTKIYLPIEVLNFKVNSSDIILNSILKKQADIRLLDLPYLDNFDDYLERVIVQSINDGNTNLDYIAGKMGFSTRVFQIKLKRQGYNFKEKLSEIRKKMAFSYLSNNKLSVLDISMLLAYREQTSFIRAFRVWTGISPSKYRRSIKLV